MRKAGMAFMVAGIVSMAMSFAGRQQLPAPFENYHKKILALEFVRTVSEAQTLGWLAGPPDVRQALRADSLVIIPLYWLLLVGLAAFLYSLEIGPAWMWVFVLPLTASTAAVLDLIENACILAAIHQGNAAAAAIIYCVASVKWALLGISFGLVASGFLLRAGWSRVAGAAYLFSAVAVLFSLYDGYKPYLEYTFGSLGVALILTGKSWHQ